MLALTTLTASSPRISLSTLRNACIALALAFVALGSSAGIAMAWDAGAFSADDEQLLFSLTNQDRASAGLNALVNDSYLHKEAEWRAKDMGDRNYFSHTIPPDNLMVFNYMDRDGYCYTYAGENIASSTYDASVATNRIETAFMNSSSHRANILGTWAHLGIGAYQAAGGRKLYAVLFSIPCGISVPTPAPVATPTPAPVPTPTPAAPVPTPTPAPPRPPLKPPPAPTSTPIPTPKAQGTGQPQVTDEPLPTGSLIATKPSATPPASGTASASASPSQSSSSTPGASGSAPSAEASNTPIPIDDGSDPLRGQATTLRVHQQTVSQGPIESFFNALFGGL